LGQWGGIYKEGEFRQWTLFMVAAFTTLGLLIALKLIPSPTQYDRFTYYQGLLVFGWLMLIVSMVLYGRPEETRAVPDWDENWKPTHVVIFVAGTSLALIVNAVTNGFLAKYLPGPTLPTNMLLPLIPPALIPQSVSNLTLQFLWQVFGVAYGEEMSKIGPTVLIGRGVGHKWLVAAPLVVVWAFAHSIIAYGGAIAPVISAIVAGSIFMGMWILTKNKMTAILSHGTVNLILLLPTLGF